MYLYLDTKIRGTYTIILNYFKSNILDKNKIIILHKTYASNKKYMKLFIEHNIQVVPIKKWNDIPTLSGQTVIYMFNAQSNCRMVAYREAKHIFIGHGESNKLSSAKPIFRIYDSIAVAGEANIERFKQQNIFNECDEKNNKFIKVGNTFIGDIPYRYNQNSQTLLYAPTWEGGIKEENYSSIDKKLKSFH